MKHRARRRIFDAISREPGILRSSLAEEKNFGMIRHRTHAVIPAAPIVRPRLTAIAVLEEISAAIAQLVERRFRKA